MWKTDEDKILDHSRGATTASKPFFVKRALRCILGSRFRVLRQFAGRSPTLN